MERQIGEIFNYGGEWYQCVNQNGCCNCAFYNTPCHLMDELSCDSLNKKRKEKYIFKRLEKVGEPFERNGYMYQEYKTHTYPLLMSGGAKIPTDNGFAVIINKEDMETTISKDATEHSNIENTGKNLKPFDLEAAKSGKPVCTRNGRKARILCFDRNAVKYHIVALIECKGFPNKEEEIKVYDNDGKYFANGESPHDLMMLPEKKEGWVNVSKFSTYASKEEALSHKTYDIIDTIKVSWEE